ncbi:hypothetical protein AAY473_014611 [Plecturocebus cupreus]
MQGAGRPQGGSRHCAVAREGAGQAKLGRRAASGRQRALRSRGSPWAAAGARRPGESTWPGGGGAWEGRALGGGARPSHKSPWRRCLEMLARERAEERRTRIAHSRASDPLEPRGEFSGVGSDQLGGPVHRSGRRAPGLLMPSAR